MRERINKNVIGMWSALKGLMVLVVILTHSIAEGATLCAYGDVYPIPFRVLTKGRGIVLFTFFMINGYLMRPVKSKGEIKRHYFNYLKIYFFTLLTMAVACIIHNLFIGEKWNVQVWQLLIGGLFGATNKNYLSGYQIPFPSALWFFVVLMNASLLLDLIGKLDSGKAQKAIIYGIPFLFFLWYFFSGHLGKNVFVNIPFYPVQTSIAIVLLYVGYEMKKSNILFVKINWYWKAGIALLALFTYLFGQLDSLNNEYRLGILECIGGICGSFVFIYIYLQLVNPEWKLIEWLMWIGRRSLWIIPVHCVEEALFRWDECSQFMRLGIYGSTSLIFFIRLFFIIVVCCLMEMLQKKIKKKKFNKYAKM